MEITFERNVLYEEVWATPPTHLAKKYRLTVERAESTVCNVLEPTTQILYRHARGRVRIDGRSAQKRMMRTGKKLPVYIRE